VTFEAIKLFLRYMRTFVRTFAYNNHTQKFSFVNYFLFRHALVVAVREKI
jgi:hypothetical protein